MRDAILRKEHSICDIILGNTRRCTLGNARKLKDTDGTFKGCKHCENGFAQNVNVDSNVYPTLFKYLKGIPIDKIIMWNGNPVQNPDGLEQLADEMERNDISPNHVWVYANPISAPERSYKALDRISKRVHTRLRISDCKFHKDACTELGLDMFDELRKTKAICSKYGFATQTEEKYGGRLGTLFNSGRANELFNTDSAKYYQWEGGESKEGIGMKPSLRFQCSPYTENFMLNELPVDEYGQILKPGVRDYIANDADNYGSILDAPSNGFDCRITQMLIENGRENLHDL